MGLTFFLRNKTIYCEKNLRPVENQLIYSYFLNCHSIASPMIYKTKENPK